MTPIQCQIIKRDIDKTEVVDAAQAVPFVHETPAQTIETDELHYVHHGPVININLPPIN